MGGWRGGRVLYTISENIGSLGKKMKAVEVKSLRLTAGKEGEFSLAGPPPHRSRVVLQGA